MRIGGDRPPRLRGVSKKIGDAVTLRPAFWEGPHRPLPGDLLRTSTGRCYLVREVVNRKTGRVRFILETTLVPEDIQRDKGSREFRWLWKRTGDAGGKRVF